MIDLKDFKYAVYARHEKDDISHVIALFVDEDDAKECIIFGLQDRVDQPFEYWIQEIK